LSLLAATILALTALPAGADEVFTFVALPDTQKYSENLFPPQPGQEQGFPPIYDPRGTAHIFGDQTQWIVNNSQIRGIEYVVHLGDIVEHGNDVVQWNRAKAAMNKLNPDPSTGWGGIAYGTCMGNHDNHDPHDWPDLPEDISGDRYLEYFSAEHDYAPGQSYSEQTWWAGHSPSGLSNAQVMPAGQGREVLFVNLAIDSPQPELDWAQSVLDAHADIPTVVSTHRYLYDFRLLQGRYGDGMIGVDGYHSPYGLADEQYAEGTVWPQEVWETFVSKNRNIFMVLSGHCHGQYHQVSYNEAQLPVVEVLTDYQDGPNGGNGFLRIMDLDFDTGRIHFETYSPTLTMHRSVLLHDYLETLAMVDEYGRGLWGLISQNPAMKQQYGVDTYEELLDMFQADVEGFDLADHEHWQFLVGSLMQSGQFASQPEAEAYAEANYKWEGLWMAAFAPDASDPLTALEDGPRAGQFTIDLADYGNTDGFAAYVPEPATLSVLSLGGLAILRRRRR
jgi:hypothetical protein